MIGHREPRVDEHGGVVIPVKEHELLFAHDYEARVDELDHFAEGKEIDPAGDEAEIGDAVADGGGEAFVVHVEDEIGPEADRAEYAEHGQDDVPGDERSMQVDFLAFEHHALTGVHEEHVDDRVDDAERPVVGEPLFECVHELGLEEFALEVEARVGRENARRVERRRRRRRRVVDCHCQWWC